MTAPGMEIVRRVDFDATEARAITDQIRSSMGNLMMLVSKAWHGRVWIALGYESWSGYIKGEFDHAPLALPREERQAVSVLLRGQGMSTRAIAPALGVHHDTLASDLSPVGNPTPESEAGPITGLDGKTYQPKPPVPQPDAAPTKARKLSAGERPVRMIMRMINLVDQVREANSILRVGRLDDGITADAALRYSDALNSGLEPIFRVQEMLLDRASVVNPG